MFVRETAAQLLAPGEAQPSGVGIGSIYALSCRSESVNSVGVWLAVVETRSGATAYGAALVGGAVGVVACAEAQSSVPPTLCAVGCRLAR